MITVVTAITGKKDNLLPQTKYKNVEYVAFLDEEAETKPWQVKKACDKFDKPVMNAKIHKILTHKYTDSEYIVWMDGSMTLKIDPHMMVDILGDKDFAFFNHHSRNNVYTEIKVCLQTGRGEKKALLEQKEAYLKQGFPSHTGLCEVPAFIRKNNVHSNTVFEKWWAEICRYSSRDQVSFPVVFKNESWATIPGNVFGENDYFEFTKHNYNG